MGRVGKNFKKAKEAGVKVFAYDRLITKTGDVDYYTTFDNFGVGVLQATSLVAGLKELRNEVAVDEPGGAGDEDAHYSRIPPPRAPHTSTTSLPPTCRFR